MKKKKKKKIRESLKLMSSRYFVIHKSTHSHAHNHLFIHALNKLLQAAFYETHSKKKRKKSYSIKLNVLPLNQIKFRHQHVS